MNWSWLTGSLESVVQYFSKPLVKVLIAISAPLAVLLGGLRDPVGFANWVLLNLSKLLVAFLPSTPDHLTIAALLQAAADSVPVFIGWGILVEIYQACLFVLSAVILIKIWKLLPFT